MFTRRVPAEAARIIQKDVLLANRYTFKEAQTELARFLQQI